MPRNQVIYTAREVAGAFDRAGLWAEATKEADDLEDGEVSLTRGYGVQVGEGYLILTHWNEAEGSMTYLTESATVQPIIDAYRKRLAD